MNNTHPFRPRIRTQAELHELWRTLMGSEGHHRHGIWFLMIEPDDRPLPTISEIEGTGPALSAEERARFAEVLRAATVDLPDGTRIAFLITRPGSTTLTGHDRDWAAALYDVAHRAGLGREMVHLATDDGVVPVPPDALDRAV